MTDSSPTVPDLAELVGLFYPSLAELGQFSEVADQQLPEVYQRLLSHNGHMTETVEEFHHSKVDVSVLAKSVTTDHYARKILLKRQSDNRVVQFGIMRIRYDLLTDVVRSEIESEDIPLGRVLISHNVLREVELVSLWKIQPGAELAKLLGAAPAETVYGRTALIHVDGEPGVELLEIVSPESEAK